MLAVSVITGLSTMITREETLAQSSVPALHLRFDEGAGTAAADASTNGNTAALIGTNGPPQWTSGMRNNALYFDGIDDSVQISSSIALGSVLDLSRKNRTYAAWVKWDNDYSKHIVVSNDSSAHLSGLFTTNTATYGRFRFVVEGGTFADPSTVCAAVTPTSGRWYHVTGTWDGSVGRIYVDGTPCNASAPGTTDYNLSGDQLYVGSSRGTSGFWKGEIDDVRIYDRALAPEEVLALHMETEAPADTTAPSISVTAPSAGTSVIGATVLSADASDDVGVVGVQFKVDGANLGLEDTIAPYSVMWDSRAASNTSHTLSAVARDAAGNTTTAAAVQIAVENVVDTTPPSIWSVAAMSTATAATITWTTDEAADTQVDYGVSAAFGSQTTRAGALVTAHSQSIHGLVPGTRYHYRALSRDVAGNTVVSGDQTFTTSTAPTVPPPPTTSAHYRFDEGSGTTAADASGGGHTATLIGTTGLPQWTSGMRTNALYFDGLDDSVRISSAIGAGSVLDVSGKNRTYAAWVKWDNNYSRHIVVSNDSSAHLAGLFTTNGANFGRFRFVVEGGTFADSSVACMGVIPVTGRWYHVAGTWDGSVARIYVDGTPCNASAPGSTDYNMSGDQLHVGSSRGTAGFWKGEIDDVRIYDRALRAEELQALFIETDAAADTTSPSISVTAPGGGTSVTGNIVVSAGAWDDVGVVAVQFKVDGADVGPEDTAAPYSLTWDSRHVSNGSHTISAVARDATGNVAIAAGVQVAVENAVDTAAPVISEIGAQTTTTTASIDWTTDEGADSKVEYGVTAAYGSETTRDGVLVTAHSQSITGLAPATQYYYRIHSRDSAGYASVSAGQTFSTLATPPGPPVVAHFRFDEGTGRATADASVNGNADATLTGANGLPQWTSGIRNNALYFDGIDDSVRLTDAIVSGSALDLSGKNRTYGAWVKWNNSYGKHIVVSNDGSARLSGLLTANTANLGRFRFVVEGGTFGDSSVVCTTITPAVGRWYHVTGTWDGSVARIYVDGKACNASAPGTTDYNMSADQLHVGSSRGTAGFWKGEIDDVRFYELALTAEEVHALHMETELQRNRLPSVAIVSPEDGASSTEPVNIVIDVAAADSDGTIREVQFHNGADLLGSDPSAPYSHSWSNVLPGTYSITAKAIDDAGGLAVSSRVNVTVKSALPSVTITSPDPDLSESGGTGVVLVSRTGPTAEGLSVAYTVSGSAVNGSDYLPLSGVAFIPAGASSVSLALTAIDDLVTEETEDVTVSLGAQASYLIGGSASVTLYAGDNDGPTTGPIIIDHRSVSLYDDIPEHYMNEARRMWLNVPGESDARAFTNGLIHLGKINPAYLVSTRNSGEPEGPRPDALRYSSATWGDVSAAAGWKYWYGEEDWFTSELAKERTKAHIKFASDAGRTISAIGFGWCVDMCRTDNGVSAMDPVYMVRWAGSSVGGASGDRPWGLDADDSALTGNVVSLETYLQATREIRDFALANGIPTSVFLTTGPLRSSCAGYAPSQETGYQTFLKNDRIREYALKDPSSILFDFGDILSYSDANRNARLSYANASISVTYPTMHPDNMVNFDGSNVLTQGEAVADDDGDHIGHVGSLRLAKAAWVLMARLAGWDGRPEH